MSVVFRWIGWVGCVETYSTLETKIYLYGGCNDDQSTNDDVIIHSVFLATIRTQDVAAVGKETSSEQRRATLVAGEAVGVPVLAVERYEFGAVDACKQDVDI